MSNKVAKVVIVDKNDRVIGFSDFGEALAKGSIRRVSRVLLKKQNQILLQKRARHMKFYPSLWDSSAAGQVDEGETYIQAAQRELSEELGIEDSELEEVCNYYSEEVVDKLVLRQYNSIFLAIYSNQSVTIQESEVDEVKWFEIYEISKLIEKFPEIFTPAFLLSWRKFQLLAL